MMIRLLQFIYNNIIFTSAGVRASFWGLFLKELGSNCQIMSGVKIFSPFGVKIGNNVCINHNVEIGGQLGLIIGNYVMVGPYVQILTADHRYDNHKEPLRSQGLVGGKTIIEDDVWIGAFAIILPKVRIGKGSIIGAHAVVTHDVLPYSIVGGVPAKFIKYRFPDAKRKIAQKINWHDKFTE